MSIPSTSAKRFATLRRLWKPTVVTGAGGTAVAIWFEEFLFLSQEILALIFLPIIAGAIYLLDTFIFRSRLPRHADMSHTHNDKGASK